ncbi:MAG: hypothetical protein SGARI_003685, partial [Bacillariaceae sp.]
LDKNSGHSLSEEPKRPRSRSSAPSRLAVNAALANIGLPKTAPKRLQLQWPPTASAYLPPRKPIRNASIRIRWVGATFLQEDSVEGYFRGAFKGMNLTDEAQHKRPDVWATPCQEPASPSQKKPWRVKRVWNVDQIDEHEEEHIVQDGLLMDKVKELLCVPSEEANEQYDPSESHWRFNKVYDLNGEVQEQSRSQKADEEGLLGGIDEVAELDAKWTFEEGTGEIDFHDDGEWGAQEWVEEQEEQPPLPVKKEDPLGRQTVHSRAPAPPPEEMTTPMRRKAKSFHTKDDLLKEEKKKNRKKRDENEPETIWDLLAPPPVTFFSGY